MRTGLLRIHDGVLTPELVDADTLLPHPENPWNGDEDVVSESMEINGMYRPIYAQKSSGRIIGGHTTWAAAMSLNAAVVPVCFLDVDDETAYRIMLVDNQAARLGRMDNGLLLQVLEKTRETSTLLGTGFVERDVEQIRQLNQIKPNYDNTSTTKPESWPTLFLTVPKHLKEAFYEMTDHAQGDHERLEALLRLAGWKPEGED